MIGYANFLHGYSLTVNLHAMSEIAELYRSENYSDRVAAEVRAHAARRGLQQQQLADALGYQQPQISKRLRGLVPFTLNEISTLAALMEVQPGDLMPPPGELVRRQGLEPRTRWFGVTAGHEGSTTGGAENNHDGTDAEILEFPLPGEIVRKGDRRRPTRRAEPREFAPSRRQVLVSL